MTMTDTDPEDNEQIAELMQLRQRRFLAMSLMAVAALFSGTVVGVMVTTARAGANTTPPTSRALETMRAELDKGVANPALQEVYRQEDARLRRIFFTYRSRLRTGAVLLLFGVVGLIVSARWYTALDPVTPMPKPLVERADGDRWLGTRQGALLAVAVVAVLAVVCFLVFTVIGGDRVPTPDDLQPAVAERAVPSEKKPEPTFRENWPVFRGPTGMGLVRAGDWPRQWNGKTGEGILWKMAVPLPGKSSPVIWGTRIFLTGGDDAKREVYCYDRTSGKLLWQTEIKSPPKGEPVEGEEEEEEEVYEDTGYAAPTAATDGERVYVTFATADIAALDFDGKIVWQQDFGPPDNVYSMSSSLTLFKDRVIWQLDKGSSGDEEKSSILALEGKTGKVVWQTPRPVGASWSSPVLVQTPAGPRIFTVADPWVTAYEPEFGAEIWRAKGLSGDVAPAPVYADGKVFATNEYAQVMAIRDDGQSDVTETHVVWIAEDGMSDAPSPLCDGKLFFQAHSSGQLTCYDAKTGKLLWEKEFGYPPFIPSDVLDWPAFCTKLKQAGQTDAPGPCRRVWQLLPAEAQKILDAPELGEEAKTAFLKALNKLLKKRDFYQAESFGSLALPEQAKALLAKSKEKKLPYDDVLALNRLLIVAAFPDELAKGLEPAEGVWASPALVGDLVYLPAESGRMYFLKLDRQYRLLGKADLGEKVYASPAFADGLIYVRGVEHLFCIGRR